MKHLIKIEKLPAGLRDGVRAQASRRIAKLKRQVRPFTGKMIRLFLVVQPAGLHGDEWEAHLVLKLSSGVLSAERISDPDPVSAVNRAFDELEQSAKSHLEVVRRKYRSQRKLQHQESLRRVNGELHRTVADGQQDSFELILRPRIDLLRRTASRALEIVGVEGNLPFGHPGIEDVINETLLAAWSEYAERPTELPLDVWLTGLLLRVIGEEVKKCEDLVPLPDALSSVKTGDDDYDPDLYSDSWWWSRIEQVDDILWEDLLPDDRMPDGFSRLSAEENQQLLLLALSKLSPPLRNAIVLYALDGYDMEEIKNMLGTSIGDVTQLLDEARSQLREFFVAQQIAPLR